MDAKTRSALTLQILLHGMVRRSKELLYYRLNRGDNLGVGGVNVSDKKQPDSSMIMDVDGKQIDVDIYLDNEFKAIRYEITSLKAIEPLESAFVLWVIVKGICDEAGINPDILMSQFTTIGESEVKH
jgi:hypothetical protein